MQVLFVKDVLINCTLWKVLSARRKCIIHFFLPFLTFFLIWWVFQCHEGTDFYKQTFVSLVQNTSILMKKRQQWVFIDVMYYSTAFLKFLFSKNVSYLFCLLRCTYFCLNGPAEKTKLLYFLHISHFNLLLKNSFCHLSHFDSLPLWIIKTFFKCSILLFCQVFFLLCNRMYSSFALFEPLSPPAGWFEKNLFIWWLWCNFILCNHCPLGFKFGNSVDQSLTRNK